MERQAEQMVGEALRVGATQVQRQARAAIQVRGSHLMQAASTVGRGRRPVRSCYPVPRRAILLVQRFDEAVDGV